MIVTLMVFSAFVLLKLTKKSYGNGKPKKLSGRLLRFTEGWNNLRSRLFTTARKMDSIITIYDPMTFLQKTTKNGIRTYKDVEVLHGILHCFN